VAVVGTLVSAPALAEHNIEHVREETERLKDLYLVPGYGNEAGQIVTCDPYTEDSTLDQVLWPYGVWSESRRVLVRRRGWELLLALLFAGKLALVRYALFI
jgi:hypothetical protein